MGATAPLERAVLLPERDAIGSTRNRSRGAAPFFHRGAPGWPGNRSGISGQARL